jgi:hypothetical protein
MRRVMNCLQSIRHEVFETDIHAFHSGKLRKVTKVLQLQIPHAVGKHKKLC